MPDITENFKSPGQLISALLEQRGWTQRVLAIVLDMEETGVNKVVADKRAVTPDLAISLEEVFDVPAENFLDLQRHYDLAKARIIARPNPRRATRAHLFSGLPVAEMIRRGWLLVDDVRNVEQVEAELTRFFGVGTVEEIEILPHTAKKTDVAESTTPAQLAWLYRVKQIASEMLVAQYFPAAVEMVLTKLRVLLGSPEESRKVPKIMADAGIRYVIVEALHSTKVDGVCFWLNDTSPVIAMSLRFDRIDNFWFVLRHEIEHVLQRHGQRSPVIIDAELEGERAGVGPNVSEEERVANEAASNFCVPRKSMDSFIARKDPLYSERDLLGLARTLNVHPGLVAGQLQHRTGRYEIFRSHLAKIRAAVAPSAIVDGWGNIVPVGT